MLDREVSDFAVGMPVVCTVDYPDENDHIVNGWTGVVACIKGTSGKAIGVEWDQNCNGHDLRGNCRQNHGWWCRPEWIAPMVVDEIEEIAPEDFPDISDLIGG